MRLFLMKFVTVSEGGKKLPWFTRKIMSFMKGYNHEKYWHRRSIVVNPNYKIIFIKLYYLLYIKHIDYKCHCSFGTMYNGGAHFVSPPYLPHGPYGIIVGNDAKIGEFCVLYHQVTIPAGGVVIGNRVTLFPGAKVIQGVKIGNYCRIGANVVVSQNIPDYATVVPQKARIILHNHND